ncbi:nitrite reductase [Bacillus sp. CGMCC 1.16607]|uniref:nitrite reductase n=1 Tax=Bacillus sp. CGMCC 1.16607 TaxID=3351842 RepID=UPI00363C15D1
MDSENKIKLAVNGGIDFGSKLTAQQLLTIARYMEESDQLELTTFQQLYIEIPEDKAEEVQTEFQLVGLHCYPVGNFVKSLRTCNFCKGREEEGMPTAIELNKRIAGTPVPFTVKAAYTGCPIGCGEPLINDIGIMKIRDKYNLYIGGKSKGADAKIGSLLSENLDESQLYENVEGFLEVYRRYGKKREAVHKFVNRMGMDKIRELMWQDGLGL